MADVAYTHTTHPRARSIKIRVLPDNSVQVVTPPHASQRQIEAFVDQQQAWIYKTVQRQNRRPLAVTPQQALIFGKSYQRRHQPQTDLAVELPRVAIVGDELVIAASDTAADRQLDRFLRQTAEAYIVPRTHALAQKMDTEFVKIGLRQQKTRWGSCSRRGTLSFNWRLVHAPPAVIDYVIVHELAHLTHMNHSAAFWELVGEYAPEYEQHRRWLRNHRIM